jgi:hypothetical protein
MVALGLECRSPEFGGTRIESWTVEASVGDVESR